jgi:trehalose synthase-fused probable maltokinase
MITIHDNWEGIFDGPARAEVEAWLPAFLTAARWFGGKAKTIRSTTFSEILRVDRGETAMVVGFVEVLYAEGERETYTIPMTAAFEVEAARIKREQPQVVIGTFNVVDPQGNHAGVLYDALWNRDCAYSLLTSMGRHAQFRGSSGTLVGSATELFDEDTMRLNTAPVSVMKAEQSNTSVKFDDRVIMKLYRRSEPGVNPELEIGRVLTARHFRHSPSLVGALEYTGEHAEPTTLALAQTFLTNQGNAWEYVLSQLSLHFASLSSREGGNMASTSASTEQPNGPSTTTDSFIDFADCASLLGRRTGELHVVLGQPSQEAAFAPEACSKSYVQSRIQSMLRSATHALTLLRNRLSALSISDQEQAKRVLEQEAIILDRFESLNRSPLTALRIRCHGDYHLGQVLYTGQDFVIIDYEGEPARSLAERRLKHLPIVDLAGMIRSFHYAAHAALRQAAGHHPIDRATQILLPWAEEWYRSARAAFLKGYHAVAGKAGFSPHSQQEHDLLLDVYLLDKAVYELTYELNNRPDWVALPLAGIRQCVEFSIASHEGDIWAECEQDVCDPCTTGQPRDEVNQ